MYVMSIFFGRCNPSFGGVIENSSFFSNFCNDIKYAKSLKLYRLSSGDGPSEDAKIPVNIKN